MEKIMDNKKWRNLIISVAFFILGWVMPEVGTITKDGMFALGCFVSLIYAMSAGVEAWYVIFALLIFGIKKSLSITSTVFPAVFGNYILWFIILSFWYMGGVAKTGFLDYITRKFLSIKVTRKGPYWLMTTLLVSTFVAVALTQSILAVFFLMMAVLRGVQKTLDMKLNDPWIVATGVGIGFCCVTGSVFMPFNFSFFMYGGFMASTYGWVRNVNAGAYTIQQTVAAIVAIALRVAVTKLIIRPKSDFSRLTSIELTSEDNEIKFNKAMGMVVVTIIILVVVVGLPSLVPQTSWAFRFFSNTGITAAFAVSCALLMFVKNAKGERCLDFGKMLQENTNWTMIFYIGAIIYFGNFISEPDAGIMAQVAIWCGPLSNLSPFLLICILGLLANLLTNATNNMVVALLMAPIGYAVVGLDSPLSQALTVMVVVSSLTAVALPSSSTVGIMTHAQKDLFSPGRIMKYGYAFAVLCFIGQFLGLLITQGMY